MLVLLIDVEVEEFNVEVCMDQTGVVVLYCGKQVVQLAGANPVNDKADEIDVGMSVHRGAEVEVLGSVTSVTFPHVSSLPQTSLSSEELTVAIDGDPAQMYAVEVVRGSVIVRLYTNDCRDS